MKIGLIIVNSGSNYGALLQAFATQQYIESLGCETEIIRCKSDKSLKGILLKIIKQFIPVVFRISVKKIKKRMYIKKNDILKNADKLRDQVGGAFVEQYLHNIVCYNNIKELSKETPKKYSAILIGSDQQWTPQCFYNKLNTLAFVPHGVKKVSYATSMGVSCVPWYTRSLIRKYISKIENISVREKTAKKLLENLTRRKDIFVVPDPTILLKSKDWDSLIPKIPNEKGEYIFCYFLANNGESMMRALKYAEQENYRLLVVRNVEIFEKDYTDYGDSEILEAPTVEEFVNYIRNAKYVFTDSFHGTVFSIISHTQFVTFYRTKHHDKNSRNSRIDDFLGELHLEDRIADEVHTISDIVNNKIDFGQVDKQLEDMREIGRSYLEGALK